MTESETMETDADQRHKNHSSSGAAFSRTVLSAVLVCIVIVGYVLYRQFSISAAGPQSSRTRTVTVTATAASESTWSNELEAIGTLEANQGIDVTSSLDGTVASIHFESGNEVDMGELLVELDTSVERAKLASISIARKRQHWASTSISSEESWQACWGEITSTTSVSTIAVTASFLRSSESSEFNPIKFWITASKIGQGN